MKDAELSFGITEHLEDLELGIIAGKEGIVRTIDDFGQIHGSWGGCAIVPDVDEFEIIERAE